ncbi:MAG: GAF domain-containing protein, partial [Candidatus Promineifilaceae bacterium]
MTIEQIFDITVYDPQATWREVTSWLPSQQTFNIRYIESLDQFDQQQLTLVRLSAIDHLIPLTNGDAPNLIACIEKGEFAFAIEAMNKKQLYSYVLVEEVKALLSPIARAFYRPKSDYLTTIKQVLFQTSSTPDSPGTKIRVTKLLHQMFNYQLAAVRLVDGFNNLNLFTEAVFGLKRSPEAQRSIALTNSPVLQNVVRTRDYWQTIDVQYYSSEDQLIQLAKSEGVRGLVIVPLVLRKDVLGVLIVGSGFPYLPSAEELVLLECLAEIASLDHNNYRNFQMLKLLETINRRLVTMESLEQTIQEIPEHAINVSQAQRMAFGFYLAAKTQYVPEWSKSKNIDEAQLTWAEKDSAWVQLAEYVRDVRANPKGELLIPNIETPTLELTRIIERLRPFFEHHGIKALVGMRLQPSIRGNAANGAHHSQQLPDALGVLFVFYQSAHPYALDGEQHEDKRPLNIYCDQLAATLHRTHQILRTDRERKMLQEFAKATNSSSPRHATDTQIWHTILNDLMDHTGAQSACMGIKQKNERWQYYREGVDIDLAKQWVKYTEQVEKGYELEDVYRNRLLTPIRKTDSNEFVGAICLFSAEHHRFDDYDGEECANLAVYIGIESQIGMLFDNQEEQKKQLEALTISSHQLTLIRPIRHDIENELKRLRRYIHYDLIILHPYSPYWEQFNSEIISLRQPSYQQYVRWDINS